METRPSKTAAQSRTEQVHIVMPPDCNGYGRLFGGRLVEWIDIVAGVVARRHSNREITTAAIDSLQFKEAVHNNQTIVLIGELLEVGNSSMLVKVSTYSEDLGGERRLVNSARLIMVALDENERPTQVPLLA
jgi:acyl-CoA hydrolase